MKLLVVAHPDDETLFFSSYLDSDTKVICVTDANADGRGIEREKEFQLALKEYNAQGEMWDFPDIYDQRLDLPRLESKIKTLGDFDKVFTHGPIGEYGHPHHQDVCMAVFNIYPAEKIWVPAFNAYPDINNILNKAEFDKKKKVLAQIYGKETNRFLNLINITSTESFMQVSQSEVQTLYNFFTQDKNLKLDKYQDLASTLINAYKGRSRIF
jgi:LmbE family N-acetylglucosaminyl deacetylase